MKKLALLTLSVAAIMIFNRCSNDVDINASYEQIVVVYGLLDPNDDTTYLKINKAFLGPDNALVMAKVPDSSNFIGALDVRVWPAGNPEDVHYFDTITINDKEEGTFYNPNQLIYYSAFSPDPDENYMLRILYKDEEISAEAITFSFATTDITSPGFALKIGINNDANPKAVTWNRKDDAPRYDVTIRFHFREIREDIADTVYRSFDWHRDTQKSTTGEEVESYYTGSTFYAALTQFVPYEDPDEEAKVIARFTGNIDFIVEAGGTELNTYMEVNEPSSSIIQDRPEYTNITNGIGIFSSRARAIKTKKLNDQTVALIKEDFYYLRFQY
jgi:hypothetical protein